MKRKQKYIISIMLVCIFLGINVKFVKAEPKLATKEKLECFLTSVTTRVYPMNTDEKFPLTDDVMWNVIYKMNWNYSLIPSNKKVHIHGYDCSFFTKKELDNFAYSLFGKKFKNIKNLKYGYYNSPKYGMGCYIMPADGDLPIVAHINKIKKMKSKIKVYYQGIPEFELGENHEDYGDFEAVFKKNKKSPIGYQLVSLKRSNN